MFLADEATTHSFLALNYVQTRNENHHFYVETHRPATKMAPGSYVWNAEGRMEHHVIALSESARCAASGSGFV